MGRNGTWDYAPGLNEPSKVLGMAYLVAKTQLDDTRVLSSGIGFGMRMPDLGELYNGLPFVPVARFGNSSISGYSELAPEKALQFDLGIQRTEEKFTYGVRGFYSLVWDYTLPVPASIGPAVPPGMATHYLDRNFSYFPIRADLNPDGTPNTSTNADANEANYQYTNIQLASLFGGDLFAEVKLGERFAVVGNMAYVRGVNWDPVVFVPAPGSAEVSKGTFVPVGHREGLLNIYPFNTTLALRMFEPDVQRWMIEFSTRIVAQQDYVATSIDEIPALGYVTFALRGHYNLTEHLRLTLALESLFNQSYTEPGALAIIGGQGVPVFVREPGFTALVGMEAGY